MKLDGDEATPFIEIVLKDLISIYDKKFFVYELFLRFYDVFHRYHESLSDAIAKEGGSDKGKQYKSENKKIAGIKQKLIFYMAFFKRKTQEDFNTIKAEIRAYVREKVKSDALNKEMERIVRNFDSNVIFTH